MKERKSSPDQVCPGSWTAAENGKDHVPRGCFHVSGDIDKDEIPPGTFHGEGSDKDEIPPGTFH
ncbi:hypothetical protein [Gimesia chilikensis]|nr:hypothetical protein [Gimesia chilikensis]